MSLHLATLFFLVMVICEFNFVPASLYEAAKNEDAADALHFAVQVGRLDVVSLLLALFGLLFGVSAIFAFVFVKERAEVQARLSAEKEAKRVATEVAEKLVKEISPPLVRREVARFNDSFRSGNDLQMDKPSEQDPYQEFADSLEKNDD